MKTIVSVNDSNIQVTVEGSNASMLQALKDLGVKIGKTSLSDLIAGRKESACGLVIKDVPEVIEETVAEASESSAPSKMEIAQDLFAKHYGTSTPKEIKEMFMAEAGLTKHGANTYYYKLKGQLNG